LLIVFEFFFKVKCFQNERLAPKFLGFCKADLEKFQQIHAKYEHLVEMTRFLDTKNLVISLIKNLFIFIGLEIFKKFGNPN
jgi:hypothetical protein